MITNTMKKRDFKKGDIVALSAAMLNVVESNKGMYPRDTYNADIRFVVRSPLMLKVYGDQPPKAAVTRLSTKGNPISTLPTHTFFHWKLVKVSE